MKAYLYIIGLISSIFSLCITVTVIFLHIKIPKLLKHPGQYVFIQCICQLIYDLHWCISYPRFDHYSEYSYLCKIEAILLATACNLGILYVTVLGIELCIKFKFKGSIAYFKRSLIYNTTCILIAFSIDLAFLVDGQYFLTEFYTCSVRYIYADIMQVLMCLICTAIMLFSLSYMLSNKRKNNEKVIKNFAFVIFFVILTWILPSAIAFFNSYVRETYLKETAYILGTFSGTCIGLSRIINYKVLRFFRSQTINSSFKKSELKTFSMIAMEDSLHDSFFSRAHSLNDFGEFYEDQSVKIFIEIMCALSLFFYDKEDFPEIKHLQRKKSSKEFKIPTEPNSIKKTIKYNIHKQKIVLIEYQPNVFEFIRTQYFHSSKDIYESLSDSENYDLIITSLIVNNSNGSMVFITSDQKYVIKVISKHEKSVFIQILLGPYMNRILTCINSKLVRILGLFQMKPSKIYFLLMENTALLTDDCERYDLKGSTADRQVNHFESRKTILKDINFLNSGIKVKLSPDTYNSLLSTLTEDFKVLKNVGIMDYSLYLVYHPATSNHIYPHYMVSNCSVSVIDLFQLYDSQKAIERCLKIYVRCVKKHSLSSVSSNEYFQRIIDFLPSVFEPDYVN